jgi:hypothetical protein
VEKKAAAVGLALLPGSRPRNLGARPRKIPDGPHLPAAKKKSAYSLFWGCIEFHMDYIILFALPVTGGVVCFRPAGRPLGHRPQTAEPMGMRPPAAPSILKKLCNTEEKTR